MRSGHVPAAPANPTDFAVTDTCPSGPVSVAGAVDVGEPSHALAPGAFGTDRVRAEEIAHRAIPAGPASPCSKDR